MTQLFTLPKQVAVDRAGVPLSMAKLYFYKQGTTTDQAVYTTAALNVAHSQPVQADADGVFPTIYLDYTSSYNYRVQLKTSADALIYDQDVYPKDGIAGVTFQSNLIIYSQTTAEAAASVTPTNYQYVPDYFYDVRRVALSESASAATNTTAMVNAIAVMAKYSTFGGRIQLLAGTFNINPFSIPAGVKVKGAGMRATQLNFASSGVCVSIGGTKSGANKYGCALEDLAIVLSHKDGFAIQLMETIGCVLDELYLEGTVIAARTNTAIVIDGGDASAFYNKIGTVIANHFQTGCQLTSTGTQVCTTQVFHNFNVFGDKASFATSVGVEWDTTNGYDCIFNGGNMESCGTGLKLSNTTKGITGTVRFESNTVDIDWGTNTTVGFNTIVGYGNISGFAGSRHDNGYLFGSYFNNIRISDGKTAGLRNVAIGETALQKVTGGSGKNIALGYDALDEILTGTANTAVGDSVLKVATGDNNSGLGNGALTAVTTGGNNTAHGAGAGDAITTGSNNVALGFNAQAGSDGSNNIAIGLSSGTASSPHTIAAGESNRIVLGNSNVTDAYIQVAWTVVSDERDKSHIRELTL